MIERKQHNFLWLVLGFFVGGFLFSPFFQVLAEDLDVTATVPAICGNGAQEGAEECDDGNAVDDDACSNACIEEDEQGGGVVIIIPPPLLPPPPICGNGIKEGNEQCDDGNGVNGDGCAAGCMNEGPAICGNGEKEGNEQCDDGNLQNGDFCSDQCQPTAVECGNGILEINEVCDDGNNVNGDGCSAVCQEELPGAICGNRVVEDGETCDDGGQINGDGCSNVCQVEPDPICGNGVRERIEVCDDGNRVDEDGCNNRCQFVPLPGSVCGNGVNEPGEQCDDGNLRAGDGCSGACQIEDAGGGVVIADPGQQDPDIENQPEKDVTSTPEVSTDTPAIRATTTPVLQGVDSSQPIAKNIAQVAQNIGKNITTGVKFLTDEAKFISQKVEDVANNPQVEQATKTVVAPATAAVVVASVTPSLASILFPLLRFVFLQPLLLFGRKKRQSWGQVYNSLTKLPVDLAMVRLLNAKTKKILQSRVTDTQGRYFFIAEPGEYILEVTKPGFTFPSSILQGVKTDGKLVDIYHGEQVNVTENGIGITPNIPLDPAGINQTPRRIIWEKRWKVIQHAISVSGIVLTLISLYVAPVWYMWILLGVHIILYLAFVHYIKPKKPNGWGLVYEKNSTSPVGSTVVRLFTKQYNKLVSTQVTDKKGRYAFLVGPSDYYVTYEKKGYKPETSESVHIDENEKNSVIKEKIGLEKDENK